MPILNFPCVMIDATGKRTLRICSVLDNAEGRLLTRTLTGRFRILRWARDEDFQIKEGASHGL